MAAKRVALDKCNKHWGAVLGIEAPSAIVARPLGRSIVQFSRFTSKQDVVRSVPSPLQDCLLVALALAETPAREVHHDGRHFLKPAIEVGEFSYLDLNKKTTVDMPMSFDSIHLSCPRGAFQSLEPELSGFNPDNIRLDFMNPIKDPVIWSLSHCILPAFEHPEQANKLFLDHIAVAFLAYMAGTYGGAARPKPIRGGLAPRQVQNAKDILMSRLNGEISLEELARECGLSRSHFARAFRKTTGLPPHRWLMERRLERARELLLTSTLPLAEIADASGFADQSHFTRCFSAAMGIVPSEWRRLRRG